MVFLCIAVLPSFTWNYFNRRFQTVDGALPSKFSSLASNESLHINIWFKTHIRYTRTVMRLTNITASI